MVFARRTPLVTHVDIPIVELPEEFRISRSPDQRFACRPYDQAGFCRTRRERGEQPGCDLIALTGDIFDGEPRELKRDIEPLANLRARSGRFTSPATMNTIGTPRPGYPKFRGWAFTPLMNSHAVISRGAQKMVVAGVIDSGPAFRLTGQIGSSAAVANVPDSKIKILLAHQPQPH